MFMVMFVSKDADQAAEVLDLWIRSGIDGVTILESAGLAEVGGPAEGGFRVSVAGVMHPKAAEHRTLLSAVKDQGTLDRVVQATTDYVGDWSEPDVGVMFVWPLVATYGMDKTFSQERRER